MTLSGQRKPRILVVDDQDIVRYTMDVVLGNQGYEVFQSSSVMEAISELAKHRPDLVLLDMTMPDIEGIVLLRQMRKSPVFKSTPVIVLTAHSDRDFVAEALQLGVRDYVLKLGFLVEDLLARIRVRLEESGVLPARPKQPTPLENARPLASRMELGDFLEGLEGRTLPASKEAILQVSTSALSSLDRIEAQLRTDPVVASLLMAKARSLLTRRRPMARLGDALQILGVTHQRAVLEGAKAYAAEEPVPEDMLRAWVHAQFCSRWMERFCPEMPAAALVGLLHDLPEMLLLQRSTAEGWMSLKEVARSRGKILPHLVEELFGIPYGEFAGAVLRKIGLPDEVVTPILEYTNAFLGASPVPATRDALRLENANQWAHAFLAVPTRNVPIRLVSREESEPRMRSDERIEVARILEEAWSASSQVFQGMEMAPESFRLPEPQERPRLVIEAEGWVQTQGALEHLLGEVLGQVVFEPIEGLADTAWDAFVYLGDHPAKAFPNGFPYRKPLVVLHRLSKDACRFPQATRLETLRMPASLVQLERLLSGLS